MHRSQRCAIVSCCACHVPQVQEVEPDDISDEEEPVPLESSAAARGGAGESGEQGARAAPAPGAVRGSGAHGDGADELEAAELEAAQLAAEELAAAAGGADALEAGATS